MNVVYTINRLPTQVLDHHSPFETLFCKSPDYSVFKPFGCACFVLLHPHEHNKLQPRARLCCFLGYGIEHKGYRCWDPISNRLRISRHVTFWEDTMFSTLSKFHPFVNTKSTFFLNSSIDLFPSTSIDSSAELNSRTSSTIPNESVAVSDPVLAPSTSLRRSTRVRETPHHLSEFHCYSTIATLHEPRSYREASTDPHWQQAMAAELQALAKTHTWDLVDLPPNKTPIGCKWVYKIKTHSDGTSG